MSPNDIRKMYQNILSKMEECKKCKDCEVCDTVEELLDQLSYSLEKVQANDEKEREEIKSMINSLILLKKELSKIIRP
ncbi:hypothetical protein BFU36_06865 [Sulfolobus sp. A20]|uniref:hypothetical protein n=1 Tax=Saccharolobus sp. A20 TaxID=1891280 RepID=UPI00084615BA|nr:hypothetical protein [Sulfolobus sp. A20]TRM75223.1 hypothetical protein DJ532_10740 [Sulfolobus sp. A20-N-F8]TRM82050.1 hypothetical protein DJ524_01935 [Sulfolobus sp. D5]TRM83576.1 hypothetical protein DJ531_04850 [Sulfolobus sp. A20-N-F6]TRM88341.1 hypothetical protein DJ529_05720 [Sulfolobus sp. C3]TRM95313.1 hypothetical protein DJ526_00760 [Sulfolobus sp. A20-N-G8]TRM98221.1 hypothetical protein DJ530_11390 [Sulfolobus sp. E1]TRN03417.1 hypothetical protein DJ527_02125 [Sulfolobus 